MPDGDIFERVLRGFKPVAGERCPDLLFLHHFATGKLSADESRAFGPHLDACLYCQHEVVEVRKLLHLETHGIPYWIDKTGRAVRLPWAVSLWSTVRSWLDRAALPHWPTLRLEWARPWVVAAAVLVVVLVAGRFFAPPALAQSRSLVAAAKQVPIIRWLLPASTQEYLEATLLQDQLGEVLVAESDRYARLARQAEAHLKRATALDPRYVDAYNALGSLYENWYYQDPAAQGSARLLGQAETAYRRAVALQPDSLAAHRGLGDIYAATGQFDKEETEYDTILAKDPDDSDTLSSRGWVRLERGAYKDAITDFRASLRHNPKDFETLTALVLAYAARGDATAVETTLRQLERVNPGRARLLHQLLRPARR